MQELREWKLFRRPSHSLAASNSFEVLYHVWFHFLNMILQCHRPAIVKKVGVRSQTFFPQMIDYDSTLGCLSKPVSVCLLIDFAHIRQTHCTITVDTYHPISSWQCVRETRGEPLVLKKIRKTRHSRASSSTQSLWD